MSEREKNGWCWCVQCGGDMCIGATGAPCPRRPTPEKRETMTKKRMTDEEFKQTAVRRAHEFVVEAHRARSEESRLAAEVARLEQRAQLAEIRLKRDAGRLADEVDVLIARRVIDSRSPAADALLDFRDPPRTERSDRLARLERENEGRGKQLLAWMQAADALMKEVAIFPSGKMTYADGAKVVAAIRQLAAEFANTATVIITRSPRAATEGGEGP